jgi:hypothetical protein
MGQALEGNRPGLSRGRRELSFAVNGLKLSGGTIVMNRQQDIESFLAAYPEKIGALANAARRVLSEALPGVEETLDQAAKVIGFGYGPGYKGCICTLIMSQKGVKLGLARGSELPDPNGLMGGSGKVHRHVALETLADLRKPGLKPLIKAALAAWKDRATAKK